MAEPRARSRLSDLVAVDLTDDTEIRSVPVAEGQRVTLWYPSANRDPLSIHTPILAALRELPVRLS